MGNFGLHNKHFTNEYSSNPQVTKIQTYKHQTQKSELPVVTSKLTDVKCELIKKYLSHYLLKKIPFEFLVTNSHNWDPHPLKPTSITDSSQVFI